MIIKVYFNSVLEMTGVGEELLIDSVTGEIMARLYNGKFPESLVIDLTQAEIQTVIMKEVA